MIEPSQNINIRFATKDRLIPGVVLFLSYAYQLACEAHEEQQEELVSLILHNIFDILDWARRSYGNNAIDFMATQREPIFSCYSTLPYPARLGDIDGFAENYLIGAA